jgi:hypothetical protein
MASLELGGTRSWRDHLAGSRFRCPTISATILPALANRPLQRVPRIHAHGLDPFADTGLTISKLDSRQPSTVCLAVRIPCRHCSRFCRNGFPHVHTRRSNRTSLKPTRCFSKNSSSVCFFQLGRT